MKYMRTLCGALAAMTLLSSQALAADYSFATNSPADYYGSTSYEDVYGAQYNYGGQNAVDFLDPLSDSSPYTSTSSSTGGSVEYGLGSGSATYTDSATLVQWEDTSTVAATQFTAVSDMLRADGSIGTLIIPKLGIRYKAYDGTTNTAMSKGVGHFPSSSAWNGNVAICGHNRGAKYTIGSVKDLSAGDTIQYETSMGTRTYAVTYVGIIDWTDWSYLEATSDNRITIITCLANQPTKRVCVQAREVCS